MGDQVSKKTGRLAGRYCIQDGRAFELKDFDPAATGPLKSKAEAQAKLEEDSARLRQLQDILYASDQWSVLLIFQAMDAAGKDSTIKHVMSGINPQGCQVFSFKAPSPEELDHDFLWRTTRCLPERGRIGIFNRSYYEEVLVVKVHPEFLERQRLPARLTAKNIWKERYEDINAFEKHLARNGTVVLKFFLHVSREEQRRRFLERLDEPAKNWKFSLADVKEREYWDLYQQAYQDMIRHTATSHAPWYVVPADHKWFTRLVVSSAIIDTLTGLELQYPALSPEALEELKSARQALQQEAEDR